MEEENNQNQHPDQEQQNEEGQENIEDQQQNDANQQGDEQVEDETQQDQDQQQNQNVEEEYTQQQIAIPLLKQKKFEVTSQYVKRRDIYEKVFLETKDVNKAICYSNIYVNIVFLDNKYPEEITQKVMKYAN